MSPASMVGAEELGVMSARAAKFSVPGVLWFWNRESFPEV